MKTCDFEGEDLVTCPKEAVIKVEAHTAGLEPVTKDFCEGHFVGFCQLVVMDDLQKEAHELMEDLKILKSPKLEA